VTRKILILPALHAYFVINDRFIMQSPDYGQPLDLSLILVCVIGKKEDEAPSAYDESKQPFLALFIQQRDLNFDKKCIDDMRARIKGEMAEDMDTKDDSESKEEQFSLLDFFATHTFAESLCATLEVMHHRLDQESPFTTEEIDTFCGKTLKETWRKIFWGLGIRHQPVEEELVDRFNDMHGEAPLTAGTAQLERKPETIEVGRVLIDTKRVHLNKVFSSSSLILRLISVVEG
jgi:hypothetical protein